MIEAAVVCLRLLQYAAGSVLMGVALFASYALNGERTAWLRPWLIAAGLVLGLAALLAFVAQTALLAGSWDAAMTPEAMGAVSDLAIGKAALWRAGAAGLAALVLLAGAFGPGSRIASAALGTLAVATFAWMGHGAASEGWLQLLADIVHVLAAATWIGALFAFVLLLRSTLDSAAIVRLERALRRFSAIGVGLVAALVLSGAVNAWFLVGVAHLGELLTTDYGRLLTIKLLLFLGMLILAALNRYRHTPAIASRPNDAAVLRGLRHSVAFEFVLALGVVGTVAWLGTLAPLAES